MDTLEQYTNIIEKCRALFLKKAADYGTSWRVYRIISVADQIYIKAKRIRTIQEKQHQKIEDDVSSEFIGIINYAVIGLIQLQINNWDVDQLPASEVTERYDEITSKAGKLMMDKNHDYGEAWREMSQESFVDLILAKILRIRQICTNEGKTIASEGIDSNFYDILNYAVFAMILITEGKH